MPENEHIDYLVFLDFETTGKPHHNALEVGWMVTDTQLEPLFEPQSVPIRQSFYNMSDKVVAMHTKNGLLTDIVENGVSVIEAEARVCVSLKQLMSQVPQARLILAGFSVHYDRSIINRDWSSLESMLHYRHFDVSVLRSAYHFWVESIPSKKDEHPHRVKADILAAWEIAKTYKNLFQDFRGKELIAQGMQL